MSDRPFIVGAGGALRPGSSTEKALRIVLAAAEARGARTLLLSGRIDGRCLTPRVAGALAVVADGICSFTRMREAA